MATILVAEDDQLLLTILSERLSQEGFEVLKAMTGTETLKAIEEKRPDLVLLDILMPELDGFAVMEKLKQNPSLSRIHVIILSNLGQQKDIERGRDLGAVLYLVKAQTTPDETIKKIREVLETKEAVQ